MTNKNILMFGVGLIVGAGSGILATMHYYKKKYSDFADQQIAEMEEYYGRTDHYIRTSGLPEDDAEVNPVQTEDDLPERANGVLSQEKRDEIKQKLLDNYAKTSNNATNYAQISKELFEKKREEIEGDEDPDLETPEQTADDEHKKNFNKPPRIISADEYMNLPPYIDTQTLYFYHYDEIITDDDENEIPDPETLIGDALTKYDFADSDESIIFVMNYQLDTAYEIQRVMGSFREENGDV